MKKTILFILLFVSSAAASWANIPSGKTIYLDVSQSWCCHKSYFIFLSGKGASYQMSPVPGKAGVYQYTTTSDTQDNIQFCYSETLSGNQQGQVSPHTGDITGWTATTPYFIMPEFIESGKEYTYWKNQSASKGETAITDAIVRTSTDCVDSTYVVTVVVEWEGAPCLIKVSGDNIQQPIVRTPDGKKLEVKAVSGLKGIAGTPQTVTVAIYSDNQGTQEVEHRDLNYVIPEPMCEEAHELGIICTDEQGKITLTPSMTGDYYAWYEGESTETFSDQPSVTLDTKNGEQTYKVEVYKTVLDPQRNLMANGGFEDATQNFVSTYTEVKYTANDGNYYNTQGALKSNLYTITSNASLFWKDYLAVQPHGGNKYALFDAGQGGYAWRTSTDINPNLKLIKDSIYAFSFWVACPNSEGYFNKPAVLQFKICWKKGGVIQPEQNLGPSYTTTFKTGTNWTQVSADWKSPVDADWVQIGVYDASTEQQGNDFCLDDIMFQKVEIKSKNMSHRDIFTYTGKDCSCNGEPMYKKWNEVVFVNNNRENPYTAYQWYLDGEPIPGATDQYYRFTQDQLTHLIHAEMVCQNGETKFTCQKRIDDINPSVRYNPAQRTLTERRIYMVGPAMRIIQSFYDDGTTETEKIVL